MSDAVRDDTIDSPAGPAPANGARSSAPPDGTLDHGPETKPELTLDHQPAGSITESLGTQGYEPVGRLGKAPLPASAPPGYELLGELGRGAMGVVYMARQVKLNRVAALKMVLAGAHAGSGLLTRFQTEAEAVARLKHPNIVQVYDSGEHDGLPYFALEYVEGGPLSKKTRRQPQPPREAARMVETLARAVAYAHEHNVLHRDLKPSNVLVAADGTLKIADFGLAKKLEEDEGQTLSGTIVGTPQYMAPEQARGDVHMIGPAVDQYALGAILYELLVGRPPFIGASVVETLEQVRSQEPVPVRQLQPKAPIDLETICLKALQKDRSKRYESVTAMADDLHRFLAGEPILARPVSTAERAWRWCRRNPKVAALSGGIAALLVVVTAGSLVAAFRINEEKKTADKARNVADEERGKARVSEGVAIAQKKVAEEQSKLAISTLYGVVNDFQTYLKRQPGKEVQALRLRLLDLAEEGLEKVLRQADESTFDRATAGVFQRRGDNLLDMDPPRTDKALEQFRKSYAIIARLEEAEPTNPVHKQNLGVVASRLGAVFLRLGDMAAARRFYGQALDARLAWKALAPNVTGQAKAVADAQMALGSVCNQMGDPAAAKAHFQASLDTLAAATPGGPKTPDDKRHWAGKYDKLGEVAMRTGDAGVAKEQFQKALALRKSLTDGPKPTVDEQRDLTISFVQLGDLALLLDRDPAAAAKWYDDALIARRRLLADDTGSAIAQRDVADACYKLATARLRAGETDRARELYAECRTRRRQLSASPAGPFNLPAAAVASAAAAAAPGTQADVLLRAELLLALARCGAVDEAAALAADIAAKSPGNPAVLYFAGCGYALCASGRPDNAATAVATLAKAIDKGWKDRVLLETDPDLDPVRDTTAFKDLLNRLPTPTSTK